MNLSSASGFLNKASKLVITHKYSLPRLTLYSLYAWHKRENNSSLSTNNMNKDLSDAVQVIDDKLLLKVDKVTGKSLVSDTEITRLTDISTGANKVTASTTNGNMLIDGVETNVYYIQSGTTEQRPIPTLIGQAYFDTDLGKQINAKSLDPVVWVDGIGTVV